MASQVSRDSLVHSQQHKSDTEIDAESEKYIRSMVEHLFFRTDIRDRTCEIVCSGNHPMTITWENSSNTVTTRMVWQGHNLGDIDHIPTSNLKQELAKTHWRAHFTLGQIKEFPLNRWEIEQMLGALEGKGMTKKWFFSSEGLKPKQFVVCELYDAYAVILMKHAEKNHSAPHFFSRLGSQDCANEIARLKANGYELRQ